jgi:uncharacterized membrane protein
MTVLAVVFPAVGGALQAIMNQLEFRRIAARSERMERVLWILRERFADADSPEELHRAMAAAREAMGSENNEWWILLGFRDPALPG